MRTPAERRSETLRRLRGAVYAAVIAGATDDEITREIEDAVASGDDDLVRGTWDTDYPGSRRRRGLRRR
jgi:hypothetical protein